MGTAMGSALYVEVHGGIASALRIDPPIDRESERGFTYHLIAKCETEDQMAAAFALTDWWLSLIHEEQKKFLDAAVHGESTRVAAVTVPKKNDLP